MASQVTDWPQIPDYKGSRREIEEWTSAPIGPLWARMKLLGSHMAKHRIQVQHKGTMVFTHQQVSNRNGK
jgi:hypothetical protein